MVMGLSACDATEQMTQDTNWDYYHGDPAGTHYSELDQINLSNVGELEIAWTYDTDPGFWKEGDAQTDMYTNPLIIDGRLYSVSPMGKLVCLDAASGEEHWVYDPIADEEVKLRQRLRGISYWSDGESDRILLPSGKYLISIDMATGLPDLAFGDQGRVDLREGLGRDFGSISISTVTPGAVFKDMIIMGSTGLVPGDVRAYDVRSGEIKWSFHTIPHPGEFGYETWPEDAWTKSLGANVWAGLTIDVERGIVFLPTASAGMSDKDFYGADRPGDNLFGSSLVALNANTGERIWHFQMVKHDLWDRDLPTHPTLVTVERDGKKIDAVAQPTKAGWLYVFDRETGEPLFEMEEREVWPSDVPGEVAAKTQIFPLKPDAFARQGLTEDILTNRTPESAKAAREHLANVSSRGEYDPPSLKGAMILPGLDGAAEWGGAAYDPETGLIYINSNEMAWTLKLIPRVPALSGNSGKALYVNNCVVCHLENMEGIPPGYPSLVNIADRLSEDEMRSVISGGNIRMPSFGDIGAENVDKIINYLRTGEEGESDIDIETAVSTNAQQDDYIFDGYVKFLDPDGYPAISPPWGTLNAIDVSSGEFAWKIPFGEYPELAEQGAENTGSENYGGAVVTKGGLLFIGATMFDNKFRAFNKKTGDLLWQTTLPAAGLATPSTYMSGGEQFVVIGAGGGKNPKFAPGSTLIAFKLKNK
ncbi:MAG: PQQ-binding-like beta-propeller repeat protein [Kordiimonadaceae bacterium]|nr:PQQ-binding-like beta-propeller repeat protein [Kordiimonadaceae bacterium]MBT6033885.1 PQQ-binding-like beta-propeller repeat protein [Kordiimonadaceae bacterium]